MSIFFFFRVQVPAQRRTIMYMYIYTYRYLRKSWQYPILEVGGKKKPNQEKRNHNADFHVCFFRKIVFPMYRSINKLKKKKKTIHTTLYYSATARKQFSTVSCV